MSCAEMSTISTVGALLLCLCCSGSCGSSPALALLGHFFAYTGGVCVLNPNARWDILLYTQQGSTHAQAILCQSSFALLCYHRDFFFKHTKDDLQTFSCWA